MDDGKLISLLDNFAGIALKSFIDARINQYLEYVDDLDSDNPNLSLGDVADCWAADAYVVAESMVLHRNNAIVNLRKNLIDVTATVPFHIDDLGISVRAANCLKSVNIYYIHELVEQTEEDLLKIIWMGRVSVREIKAALKLKCGLYLRNDQDAHRKTEVVEEGGAV